MRLRGLWRTERDGGQQLFRRVLLSDLLPLSLPLHPSAPHLPTHPLSASLEPAPGLPGRATASHRPVASRRRPASLDHRRCRRSPSASSGQSEPLLWSPVGGEARTGPVVTSRLLSSPRQDGRQSDSTSPLVSQQSEVESGLGPAEWLAARRNLPGAAAATHSAGQTAPAADLEGPGGGPHHRGRHHVHQVSHCPRASGCGSFRMGMSKC